jgi:cephalosporin-C deacetylase
MTPEVPEDLEVFWHAAAHEARKVPLSFRRAPAPGIVSPHQVEIIEFTGMGGRTLRGWIAFPPGARRLPGFLWLAPYGRESVLPDQYGTREGFASMSFNFHGEEAFHRERYEKSRGYFAEGAESPENWIFRRMLQDAFIAARVFQAQPEVDENRIGSMGMSQGGGMSIWLGAWCPIIKAVCADMPFLGNIGTTIQGNVFRYPLKELTDFMGELPVGLPRVLHTVSYFDTASQALRCRCPVQVSLGLFDPAAKPVQVRSIFEALPGDKKLIEYQVGHDWTPEMVENNRNWLRANLS